MPVVATPITVTAPTAECATNAATPPGCAVTTGTSACRSQGIVLTTTPVDSGTGSLVPGRIRCAYFNGGADKTFRWKMLDMSGNLLDMSDCVCVGDSNEPCPFSFKLLLTEYFGGDPVIELTGTITDTDTGEISVVFPKAKSQLAGMFFAQMVMYETVDGDPNPVLTNHFYLVINRDLLQNNDFGMLSGPPTIAEVRLFLRDSGNAESYLLDNFKFDDAEIALAIMLPVQYWNEIPPPVNRFNTMNFPFRYHWLHAISGHLMNMVAEHQRANHLEYSAGGVSVNDKNKELNYSQIAHLRLEEYKQFVRAKKIEINIRSGYGSFGYTYRR